MNFSIHTWNVNSVRARADHISHWLDTIQPDLFALQETKVTDDLFPTSLFEKKGYGIEFYGQKSYNGVAIGYKKSKIFSPTSVVKNNPLFVDDQARFLASSFEISTGFTIRLVCIYVPNGSEVGSDKYHYKLDFLDSLTDFLQLELKTHENICLLGDFNIAPADIDVYDCKIWHEKILCSKAEREKFNKLLALDFLDTFRVLNPTKQMFSWWDYRQAAFRRNLGLRIDHILTTKNLFYSINKSGITTEIRKREKSSDHAPCWVEITI